MLRVYHFSLRITIAAILFASAACVHPPRLTSVESSTIELNSTSDQHVDSDAIRTISPYKTTLDKEMNEVLITSENAFMKGDPEGELGDLVADIVLKQANKKYTVNHNSKVQVCVLNNGGLRVSLPKGEITKGKVFELMPFENEMIVITLSGEKTKMLFDFIGGKNGMPVAGVKMGIKNNAATSVFVNGEKFDITKNYCIVTSDYLANGGDKMDFFKDAISTETLNYKLRDALIDELREMRKTGKTLKGQVDGRVYYDK